MAVHIPHGNTKHNNDCGYVLTCPSVLRKAEKRSMTEKPYKIYKSEITQPVFIPYLLMCIMQPLNSKEVENIQLKQLKKKRLSHDPLYNVHELAHDLPEFVHSIRIYPDLLCVFGQKVFLNELDRVLLLESSSPQLLSYVPPFNLVTSIYLWCHFIIHFLKKHLQFLLP